MKKILTLLFLGFTPVLSMAAEGQTAESSGSLTTFIWIAAIVFLVTGIILGCKKIIVIYNDYLDIVISTLIFLFPIIVGFIIDKEDTGLNIFFVLVEVGLLAFMFYRTFRFNVNPFAALYALIIKLSFSLLALFCVYSLAGTSHKDTDSYQEYKNKVFALAILGALIGLVCKMVKERQWVDSTGFVELRIEADKTGQDEEIIIRKARKYHTFVIAFCVGLGVLLSGWGSYNVIRNSESTEQTSPQPTFDVVEEAESGIE